MQSVRVNLSLNAASQYTNFNYNSMCRFNGVILGAGDAGVFKACCGTSDNGTNIAAYFTTLLTNFGSLDLKRAWYVYLGGQGGGATLTVTKDEATTENYQIAALSAQGAKRIPVGKKTAWTYCALKISNLAGADFSIDTIKMFIKALGRGRR